MFPLFWLDEPARVAKEVNVWVVNLNVLVDIGVLFDGLGGGSGDLVDENLHTNQ